MTASSPADLSAAFRSFGRRLREAITEAENDTAREAAAHAQTAPLERAVNDAAQLLGVSGSDVSSSGAAVAARIDSTPADKWDEATLDRLRALATEAGIALRAVSEAAQR